MTSPIVSVIVTFHAEAEVAQLTLLGIERLRRYAEKSGIIVEFVSVLDCANSETILAVRSSSVLRDSDQVIEVNNRDLGTSRNSGIQIARGDFIGIFDGDDYYTDNWLVEALKVSNITTHNLIVHPELQISFGSVHCVAHVLDMDEQPDYPLQNCLAVHPWIACSFGAKSIYEKSPYCRADTQETGFGFEDWQWNLETIAKGGRHVCAPNTAHYYRRKPTSMLTEMVASGAVIRPTEFFDHPERWDVRLKSNNELFTHSKKKKSDILVPQWAVEGFRRIAEIEPVLYPTTEFLGNFFLYTPPLDLAPGELYAKVFALLGGFTPDIICLVPWLAWGNEIDVKWQKTFSVQASGQKVLVISSNPDDSQLNSLVPQEFKLLGFGELARNLTENQQIQVLTRLILQSTASEIYVIKSPLGWELIKRYSKPFIASNKRIYVSICNRGTDQDQNVIGEQYHTEITPWLHEYAADNNLAQSQITIWEKMAAKYIIRQEPADKLLIGSHLHRIFRLVKRFLLG